jgi:hypothetical protein
MRVPTDLQILERIYDRYYSTFAGYSKEAADRKAKIYVPIDIVAISQDLAVDGDIVFGRLYYHLEEKYGYTRSKGDRVHFFAVELGGDRHCINFPLMASVLAGLQEENRKYQLSIWVAVISLIVSIVAICVSSLS